MKRKQPKQPFGVQSTPQYVALFSVLPMAAFSDGHTCIRGLCLHVAS